MTRSSNSFGPFEPAPAVEWRRPLTAYHGFGRSPLRDVADQMESAAQTLKVQLTHDAMYRLLPADRLDDLRGLTIALAKWADVIHDESAPSVPRPARWRWLRQITRWLGRI
jgi:hypothetical protein